MDGLLERVVYLSVNVLSRHLVDQLDALHLAPAAQIGRDAVPTLARILRHLQPILLQRRLGRLLGGQVHAVHTVDVDQFLGYVRPLGKTLGRHRDEGIVHPSRQRTGVERYARYAQ